MGIEDKLPKKDDDTEILVRRICPEFVFQGKQLWSPHLYTTTEKEREQRGRYCPTHYEIYQRYEAKLKEENGGV